MRQAVSGLTPRGRQWWALIEAWERSGMKLAEFCARRGVNPGTLAWWRRELKRRKRDRLPQPAGRVELVEITPGEPRAEHGFELVLPTGVRVRVPMRFEGGALRELLAVLGAC